MDFLSAPPQFLYIAAAFLAVVVLIPVMRKIAPALGLLDAPGGRKGHDGHVPLVGGLSIFPLFILFSVLMGDSVQTHWPLYVALLVLLVTGAVDDARGLKSWIKFGMQFVAATLVVVFGDAQLYQLGDLFGLGDFGLGLISLPFSIVAVVLLINAINLMDGLDGLAGGTGFVILGWFLIACLMVGEAFYSPSIMLLMALLAGFLVYNQRNFFRKKASIFMGDAGSMALGLMVGWYAIQLSPQEARVLEPMSVAWVLALPIWDECAQFYRRVKEGRHPFSPDRGHFHHHFIRAGIKSVYAVAIVHLIVFVTGAFGVLGYKAGVPLPVLTVLWIAGILGHMAFSRNLDNYTNLLLKFKRSAE